MNLLSNRHLRQYVMLIFGLLLVLGCVYFGAGHYYRLVFNTTDSLPGRVFLVTKGVMPERGDVAAFFTPEHHLLLSDEKAAWPKKQFLKTVFGVPGDEIAIQSSWVFVNQHFLGQVLPHSSNGQTLYPIESGIIPAKHYFMGTYHERSYDSRYQSIGLVAEDQIIGRAYRLF